MIEANSREIQSNQTDIHEHLETIVLRHLEHQFLKPISEHTQREFDHLNDLVQKNNCPVILDSCCGVGESTAKIAEKHPDALVIGLDKSAHRLSKNDYHTVNHNYELARVDLNDFWRLAQQADWNISHHYLLYPNPWPKSKHVQRRWHGAAVFPSLVALGGVLELRSNWSIYLKEFAFALKIVGKSSEIEPLNVTEPLTPFERKYQQSGHQLWRLSADLRTKK